MKDALEPYLFEAGLEPSDLSNKREFAINGLVLHQVIEKRRFELDDFAKGMLTETGKYLSICSRGDRWKKFLNLGMDDFSLTSFLRQNHLIEGIVFPTEDKRHISPTEVLDAVIFEKRDDNETNRSTAKQFIRFVTETPIDGELHIAYWRILVRENL